MQLSNKPKAIVLGVGPEKGLGGALCHRFAREGHHVFLGGRSREKLEKIVTAIESAGGTATAVTCDGTSEESVQNLFEIAGDTGNGKIDLAVFNIGNNMPGLIKDMDAAYFEQAWRTVCFSGFLFGKQAVKDMLPGGGTLLFTGASASLRGKANFGAFNSAKSALRAYAQALAKEHGADGLHVGHIIIDGGIAGDKAFTKYPQMIERQNELVSLESLADAYWFMHQQQPQGWTFEMDLRTSVESW